jgi:hypothetical protein
VESATLVAVTVAVVAEPGAVYSPLELIVPAVAVHVTPVFDVPRTVAVYCCVPPVDKLIMDGLIVIDTPGVGVGEGEGVGVGVGVGPVEVIVSVAISYLPASA